MNVEHEIIELKIKYNILEKQHIDLKQNMEKRFDELDSKLDLIMKKLETIDENKNQLIGGWKIIAILGTLAIGISAFGKNILDMLK